MGANHTTKVTSPAALEQDQTDAQHISTSSHETGAPNSLVPPSRLRGAPRGKYLLSLDRSMKVFLRASNLSGLEYRLKLAGYRTFHDLLNTDRETLEAKGFTGIMAQQLMNAVVEYIQRQVYRSEEERLPFRLVRKGQRLQTEPSESMKGNPNYQKRNFKRYRSVEEQGKRSHNIAHITQRDISKPSRQAPSKVRLMTKDDLQLHHLLSPPQLVLAAPVDHITDSRESELPPLDGNQKVLGIIVEGAPPLEEPPSLQEPPFLDLDLPPLEGALSLEELHTDPQALEETDFPSDFAFGAKPLRSFSVPADFKVPPEESAITSDDHVGRIRTYSCPPSFVSLSTTQSHTSICTLLDRVCEAKNVSEVYHTLCVVLQQTKYLCNAVEAVKSRALVIVVEALVKHSEVLKVVEVCCRLIRNLCRVVRKEVEEAVHGDGSTPNRSAGIPQDSLSAVCKAMDCHSTARSLLTQALLAATSLCAADVYQCHAMLCEGLLESVARTMDAHHDDLGVQTAGIAALATALVHVPDGRLPLLLEHGHILDLVLHAMTCYHGDSRLQHYSLSFLALLVSVVAKEIDAGVIQLIIERTAVTLETMSHDSHVTYWGCKVFAHAGKNTVLTEWKVAARCCDPLMEAMKTFPRDSVVFSWAAYALCQLATSHRICEQLVASDLTALLECPSPNTTPPSKTATYLQYLHHLVMVHRRPTTSHQPS